MEEIYVGVIYTGLNWGGSQPTYIADHIIVVYFNEYKPTYCVFKHNDIFKVNKQQWYTYVYTYSISNCHNTSLYVHPCEKVIGFFCCDQAALLMVQSVCLYVRPSVTPFSPCSHHRIIMTFSWVSGVIIIDRSDVHAKGQGQRSKVKITEAKTQFSRFRTMIQVWIHNKWNTKLDVAEERCSIVFQGHPSNFKVTRHKKIANFAPELAFSRL